MDAQTNAKPIPVLPLGNGAMRVTYGSVVSGRHPNALLFIQFFEDLSGFEKVMQAIPSSKPYQSIISDHSTTPFVRNVLRNVSIPFEPTLSPMPNYLVLTRARRQTLSEGEVVDLLHCSCICNIEIYEAR